MHITKTQLQQVMPRLKMAKAYIGPLNEAMAEASIDTPLRIAAFLAQLAWESGELRFWVELSSGEAYEGREDLGNLYTGDGPRYKGRGPIQLTGRANYAAAGEALGIDLEGRPEMAAWLDTGFRVAAWYWKSRGLNELADNSNFKEITRRINGGYNHYKQRLSYYNRAKRVLEVQEHGTNGTDRTE